MRDGSLRTIWKDPLGRLFLLASAIVFLLVVMMGVMVNQTSDIKHLVEAAEQEDREEKIRDAEADMQVIENGKLVQRAVNEIEKFEGLVERLEAGGG